MHDTIKLCQKHTKEILEKKKRAENSTTNLSTNAASPKSNASKKQKSKAKKSPSPNRKEHSKRKKTTVTINNAENTQAPQPNNAERQDQSSRGLSMFPGDILDRMQNPHFLSLIKCPS